MFFELVLTIRLIAPNYPERRDAPTCSGDNRFASIEEISITTFVSTAVCQLEDVSIEENF